MDAFDREFGCTSGAVCVCGAAEFGEEAGGMVGGFGFGAKRVYPNVPRVVVDAKKKMDEAADCCFEWSSNVGEYAFAWAGSGLVAWTIMWQLPCGSELAAFAGCQVGIFEVGREAA